MTTFIILLIWIVFGLLVRTIAIKRGANPVGWTVTGFSAGPFALPFVFFSKRKHDLQKS